MSLLFESDRGVSESALVELSEAGAFKQGHFVLSRGNHAADYVNVREVYANPEKLWKLCRSLAHCIHPDVLIDVVVGPARGGNLLSLGVSYWIAQLRFPRAKKDPEDAPLRCAWTEKFKNGAGEDDFIIAPCHERVVRGGHVLLVDDVSTSGSSLEKVVRCTRAADGNVVLVATIWNRGGVTPEKLGGIPIGSLIEKELPSWPADVCPLCKSGVPINTDVGHGKEFLAEKSARYSFRYSLPKHLWP